MVPWKINTLTIALHVQRAQKITPAAPSKPFLLTGYVERGRVFRGVCLSVHKKGGGTSCPGSAQSLAGGTCCPGPTWGKGRGTSCPGPVWGRGEEERCPYPVILSPPVRSGLGGRGTLTRWSYPSLSNYSRSGLGVGGPWLVLPPVLFSLRVHLYPV